MSESRPVRPLSHDCSCAFLREQEMSGAQDVEGHYRPAIPRQGVGGFVKGAELFSVDEEDQRRAGRGEDSDGDDEEDEDRRRPRVQRRRGHAEGDEEEEDPSSLYARLLGTGAAEAAVGGDAASQPQPTHSAQRARKRKRGTFTCEVCGVEVSSVSREVSVTAHGAMVPVVVTGLRTGVTLLDRSTSGPRCTSSTLRRRTRRGRSSCPSRTGMGGRGGGD